MLANISILSIMTNIYKVKFPKEYAISRINQRTTSLFALSDSRNILASRVNFLKTIQYSQMLRELNVIHAKTELLSSKQKTFSHVLPSILYKP